MARTALGLERRRALREKVCPASLSGECPGRVPHPGNLRRGPRTRRRVQIASPPALGNHGRLSPGGLAAPRGAERF
ncbi:hypothetical protein NDU88_002381 [Pleurodeles waltl]|uniref:Uncharacterized protein n=1 Tax=Pleurodeles waltl TaxID=8319 RepID=A0AAV7WNB8_PLEWA|nr:hypothetical protein NDU88_002381 [Pleurodeles waltl]